MADDPFVEQPYLQCISVVPSDIGVVNMRKTWKAGIKCFEEIPGFWETKDEPVAICAGGPSLDDNLELIKTFKTTMVCGSAHDHLIEMGVIPTYAVITDPQACHVDFLKRKHPDVTYLVDSRVDHAIFDHLEDHRLFYWNAQGEAPPEAFEGRRIYGWGAFATIKAIALAISLGYWDQHFFGMDSCCRGGKTHAYAYDDVRPFHTVTVEGGRSFICTADMVAQAQQFFKYWDAAAQWFKPTIYGDGLIVEMLKCGQAGDVNGSEFLPKPNGALAA